MSTERVGAGEIWEWLPIFRAVALDPHLPSASASVNVSTSTVARALKRLEVAVGYQLFERRGRRLTLNDRGKRLLDAFQEALGIVDQALEDEAAAKQPPLRIAALGSTAQALVGRAIEAFDHEGAPRIEEHEPSRASLLLAAGGLDVVVGETPMAPPGTHSSHFADVEYGVYASRAHAFYGQLVDEVALRDAPLVGTRNPGRLAGKHGELPLRLTHTVPQIHTAIEICLSGRALALLAEPSARALVERGLIQRLAGVHVAAVPIHVATRTGSRQAGRIERLLAAMRDDTHPVVSPFGISSPSSHSQDWLSHGDECLVRGDLDQALAAYRGARHAQAGRRSADETLRYAIRELQLLMLRGHHADACGAAERLWQARDSQALPAHWLLLATGALAALRSEGAVAAERWLERGSGSQSALETNTPSAREARIGWTRAHGNVALEAGRSTAALDCFESSRRAASDSGEVWAQTIALYNIAETHARAGEASRALTLLREAETAKRALHDAWGLSYATLLRARLELGLHHDGHVTLATLDAATTWLQQVADPAVRVMAATTRGLGLLALGEASRADVELRRAVAWSVPGTETLAARAEIARVAVCLQTGHRNQGWAALARAEGLAKHSLRAELREAKSALLVAAGKGADAVAWTPLRDTDLSYPSALSLVPALQGLAPRARPR